MDLTDASRSVISSNTYLASLKLFTQVWDLTAPVSGSHIPHKPTYTLHPSFAIRRVAWRPGYECEIALVSATEFATGSSDSQPSPGSNNSGLLTRAGSGSGLDSAFRGSGGLEGIYAAKDKLNPTVSEPKNLTSASGAGDSVEIWDVRRGWIAKWSVTGSAGEGGVSGKKLDFFFFSYNILKWG